MERVVRFIDGAAGRILCSGHIVPKPEKGDKLFLILAPFAEEMNKSRHVLVHLAASLASRGHSALLLDVYGTGDSEGSFEDASLGIWSADVLSTADYFGDGFEVGLIGLRAGALVAAHVFQRNDFLSLTLLHPLTEGRQQIAQMLRLRVASAMFGSNQSESTSTLRAALADGKTLEIAGYGLSSRLAMDFDKLSLMNLIPRSDSNVNWIEIAPQVERGLMPVSQKVITHWTETGVDICSTVVECDQFWATQELSDCNSMVDKAVDMLSV